MLNLRMKKILFIIIFILLSLPLFANIIINPGVKKLNIVNDAMVLEDKLGSLTIKDILNKKKFKQYKGKYFHYGYSKSSLWIKWEITNLSNKTLLLDIAQNATDFIKMFILDKGKLIYTSKDIGDGLPFENRDFKNREFVFKIRPSKKKLTYIFNIKSSSYLTFPVTISSQNTFQKDESLDLALIWIFFGMMMIMAIYNFLIYTTVWDREYLYYVLFNLAYAVHVFSCKGLGADLFWRDYPVFNNLSSTTFLIFACLMQLQFAKYFLRLKEKAYYIYIIANISILVILTAFISIIFFKSSKFSSIGFLMFFLSSIILSGYALKKAIEGSKSHLYFFLAWTGAIGFTIFGGLYTNFGFVIPFVSKWSIQEGALFQTIFLSFGLSDRINTMRKNLVDLNTNLERKVKDRTENLDMAMEELEQANTNLLTTNSDLKKVLNIADMDMKMAINVQKNFLPAKIPESQVWDIDLIYKPMAGVSGDFYDFYIIENTFKGIGIFDVSGHGIASGLITTIARSIIFRHFKEWQGHHLNKTIENANKSLQEEIGNVDNYLTGAILGFLDDGSIEYVNAAHHIPLIKGATETKLLTEIISDDDNSSTGFFLGVPEMSLPYKNNIFRIKKDESILLYTDCLIEAKDKSNEEYGHKRLIASLKNAPNGTAKNILNSIMKDFNKFVEDEEHLPDDFTAIILKRK